MSSSSATPRQSSTEILVRTCLAAGEITEDEANAIIDHWLSPDSQGLKLMQRSQNLYQFITGGDGKTPCPYKGFGIRSAVIWQCIKNQQAKNMEKEKIARAKQEAEKKNRIQEQQLQQIQGQTQEKSEIEISQRQQLGGSDLAPPLQQPLLQKQPSLFIDIPQYNPNTNANTNTTPQNTGTDTRTNMGSSLTTLPTSRSSSGESTSTMNVSISPQEQQLQFVTSPTNSSGLSLSLRVSQSRSEPNLSGLSPTEQDASSAARAAALHAANVQQAAPPNPMVSNVAATSTLTHQPGIIQQQQQSHFQSVQAQQQVHVQYYNPMDELIPAGGADVTNAEFPQPDRTLIHTAQGGSATSGISGSKFSGSSSGNKVIAQQDILNSEDMQIELTEEKRIRYSQLGSMESIGRSENERATHSAVKTVNTAPAASDANWAQFHIIDRGILKTLYSHAENKLGIKPSGDACKLLSKAVQLQAKKILAQSIRQNKRRYSRQAFDEYCLAAIVNSNSSSSSNAHAHVNAPSSSEGKASSPHTSNIRPTRGGSTASTSTKETTGHGLVHSMAWGPDVYGYLQQEEATAKRTAQIEAGNVTNAIQFEQTNLEKRCVDLGIPVPGTWAARRKLTNTQLINMQSLQLPWWFAAAEQERLGNLDMNDLAKLYFANQVSASGTSNSSANVSSSVQDQGQGMSISLNRSVDVSTNYQGQDGAAHKRLRVDSPTASTSAMGDSSSSNSDSGSLRKSKETIQKEQQIRLAALRETCPLVGPSVMDKSSDVILIKDMIDSIEAAVQAQNSNTSGWYNAHLGKSLQRARLGIPKT